MSRMENNYILLPQGVQVVFKNQKLEVMGFKFKLIQEVCLGIDFEINNEVVRVIKKFNGKYFKSLQGLYISLLKNMVIGVTRGFTKILELNGIGYRFDYKNGFLSLSVGYSYKVIFKVPEEVDCEVKNNILIILKSYNKQILGEVAAQIRNIKHADPYKRKGIKYLNEIIKTKIGKSGK